MAETLRIEIPIETIDNTDPELSNVTKNFERMERRQRVPTAPQRKLIPPLLSLTGRRRKQKRALQAGRRKNMRYCWRQKTGFLRLFLRSEMG